MSSDMNLIAARYVHALFDLACEGKLHDAVKKDLLTLKSVLAQSAELRKLLQSPVITRPQTEKAITAVLTAIKANPLTTKFFVLLARQRRLDLTSAVIEKYLVQLAESRDELTVQVTSATALDKKQVDTLAGSLAKTTGKKISVETHENPALIGGLQVRIGSRMLDNSIAGKLARLRLAIRKAA